MIQGAMRHMFINNCCHSFKLFHKNSPRSCIALHSSNVEMILSMERFISIDKLDFSFLLLACFRYKISTFLYCLKRFQTCMTKKKKY